MQSASRYLEQKRQQSSARYGVILALWGVILGTIAVLAALYMSVHYYLSVPFEDQWPLIEELGNNHGSYTLPLLWALHNEHRLPFAKLLFMADLYWFQGRNISLYFEIYAMQIVEWIALVWAMRQGALWPRWMVTVGAGLAAFALFWTSQFQSFLNPIGIQVVTAAAFGTICFIAIVFMVEDSRRPLLWFVLSVVSAFISEASLANGLLLWPLLVIAAIRFRLRRHWIAALLAIAAICIAAYLIGYRSPAGHANPAESIRKPALLGQYLLIYFGNVWGSLNPVLGHILAFLGMATVSACYVWELFRPKAKPFAFAMISTCMFLLGTGFITALGRINFPLFQAAASRYQTSSLLFWLCLALYGIDTAYRNRTRYAMLASATALMLATAALPSYPLSLEGAEELRGRITAGALPLFADVKDDSEIVKLIVPPNLVFQERPFLKQHHAAFYADRRYQLLGKAVSTQFQVAPPNRCFGFFDRDRRITDASFPGWELNGWVWDHQAMSPVSLMVAVSHDGIISGVGDSGIARPDVPAAYKEISDAHVGWRLYLQGAAASEPDVKVYGVVDGGKTVCLATPAFSLPKLKP